MKCFILLLDRHALSLDVYAALGRNELVGADSDGLAAESLEADWRLLHGVEEGELVGVYEVVV